ncbi:MAG: periplasmic flagellar collar protein FlcA [Brevinema sp.]
MDFRKIFNSYSSSAGISERNNVLEQNKNIPGDISFKINEFINESSTQILLDNDDLESIANTNNIDSINKENPSNGLSDDVLDALSELDFQEEDLENSDLQNDFLDVEDFEIPNSLENNIEDNNSNFDEFDSDLLVNNPTDTDNTANLDFEEPESFKIDSDSDNENTYRDSPNIIDEVPGINDINSDDENSDLDLYDFLNDSEESSFNEDNFEDISFNDELSDEHPDFSLDDEDEFDIENPDDLLQENKSIANTEENEQPTSGFDNELDEDDLTLPDFSQTDLKPDPPTEKLPLFTETLKPTIYEESIQEERGFDSWTKLDSSGALSEATSLRLTEEQIFAIREKINSLRDKETRFNLRNILLDPLFHKEYLEQLISLLLIDTPEEKIIEFLSKHLQNNNFTPNYSDVTEEKSFATFFAEDILRFEQFKEEFTKTSQKMTIFGFLSLIMGLIVWFGVAQPLRVTSLLKKGIVELKNDSFTSAESLFNQAHKIAGTPIPKWFIAYGDEYAKKDMIKLAEQKYLAGIIAAPKNIDINMHVSDFYTNLGMDYFPRAISIMKNLSLFHPKKFEVWDYYGDLHLDYADYFPKDITKKEELYFKAANIYNEFIKNNLKNIAPYYKMIDVYIRLNNESQIDTISEFINKVNPKYLNLDILNKLAAYYLNKRKLNQAADIFKKMIPFLDNHVRRIDSLKKSLKKTYNIKPEGISNLLSESFYEVSRFKMLSSDIVGAISLLSNAIKLNPNSDKSYNLMGEFLLAMGDGYPNRFDQSEALFKKALDINPNAYKPHINLGHLNYYWGNEIDALTTADSTALYHYRTAKNLMPTNELNHLLQYNLSWLEHKNGDDKDAIDLLSEIYKNTPNNPTLNYAMGSILYKSGNPRLAQVKFQEAAIIFDGIKNKISEINYNSVRHREIFTQLSKIHNNLGVINANYGRSNPNRQDYFNSQALLHFYESKNLADQLGTLYDVTEYNIGVLTRSNIKNRDIIFDESIPRQTSLEPLQSEFKKHVLEKI